MRYCWLLIAGLLVVALHAGVALAHSDASSFGGGAGTHDHAVESTSQPRRFAAQVIFDPRRIHDLSMKVNAQIVSLQSGPVGSRVKAGQVLASFSSAELNTLQTTFAETVRYADRMNAASVTGKEKLLQGRLNLLWRGLSEEDVAILERTRKPIQEIDITAPVTGTLTEVNIRPGGIVNAGTRGDLFSATGMRIFRIVEENALLIEAQLPVDIAEGLEPEDRMLVSLAGLDSEKQATAVISSISPLVPEGSQVRTVRLVPSDHLMTRLVAGQRLLLRVPETQDDYQEIPSTAETPEPHQPAKDSEAVSMPDPGEQAPAAGADSATGGGHD